MKQCSDVVDMYICTTLFISKDFISMDSIGRIFILFDAAENSKKKTQGRIREGRARESKVLNAEQGSGRAGYSKAGWIKAE